MNRFIFLSLLVSLFIPVAFAADVTNDEVTARREVLDLAGAFQNDGFRLRDGTFYGTIAKGKDAIIAVNLYSGNGYWFSVAGTKDAKDLNVSVYDESGNPVSFEPYSTANRAAAGFSPDISGEYFVKVTTSNPKPTTFCLIYSYK
jgi:hypothetical protein